MRSGRLIVAVAQWDDATVRQSTDGLNVVAYLARFAPLNVAVHAHSHENLGYNYADVASLAEAMTGLPSTNLVGGYIAAPATSANWERFRQPMQGALGHRFAIGAPDTRRDGRALGGGRAPCQTWSRAGFASSTSRKC